MVNAGFLPPTVASDRVEQYPREISGTHTTPGHHTPIPESLEVY